MPAGMSARSADEPLLRRALELARAGIGLASPNPHVGAVITDAHGNVAGEGTYTYAGVKHAEILALEAAGSRARAGTLYINLEPHGHHGRTPPCTEALIKAGIRRVVASMADPNPKVSGKGFDQLRAAGIEVEVGGIEAEARRINEAFARYIRHGIPFVTLKSAMTMDAKIALAAGAADAQAKNEFSGTWLTGESARAHVHELRHENDAIMAGIRTILADNALLTDRSGLPRRRRLLRVILDSRLRLPFDSRLVQSADGDVLVFCSSPDKHALDQLKQRGIAVEIAPATPDGRLDLAFILRRLAEMEILSVMIEGGSTVNASALAAKQVDKVFLYYAPKVLGAEAIPFSAAGSPPTQADLKQVSLHRFGEDFAVEGYLRDPYAE